MRVVGIDLGKRRIGVAASDRSGLLASPRRVLERCGDPEADLSAIAEIVAAEQGELVVVGLPVSLDGRSRAAAVDAIREADALRSVVSVPVELYDERLTTVLAARLRIERPPARGTRADVPRPRSRRDPIDAEAAAVMLQSWLDARRQTST